MGVPSATATREGAQPKKVKSRMLAPTPKGNGASQLRQTEQTAILMP